MRMAGVLRVDGRRPKLILGGQGGPSGDGGSGGSDSKIGRLDCYQLAEVTRRQCGQLPGTRGAEDMRNLDAEKWCCEFL